MSRAGKGKMIDAAAVAALQEDWKKGDWLSSVVTNPILEGLVGKGLLPAQHLCN